MLIRSQRQTKSVIHEMILIADKNQLLLKTHQPTNRKKKGILYYRPKIRLFEMAINFLVLLVFLSIPYSTYCLYQHKINYSLFRICVPYPQWNLGYPTRIEKLRHSAGSKRWRVRIIAWRTYIVQSPAELAYRRNGIVAAEGRNLRGLLQHKCWF